jgi:hypothetical protein
MITQFSWVMWHMWLVWVLTTKHYSLKRVETCQKKHFNSDYFMFTRYLDLTSNGFTLRIFIFFDLFCIEPLIVHLFSNDVIILVSENILRFCLVDYTCVPYSSCLLNVFNHTYWPAWAVMVKIISSCLVCNCYPTSYETFVLWLLL